jgi:uncharacterized lipoprotein YmbA
MMKDTYLLKSKQMMQMAGVAVAAAVLMAGCANTEPPIEQMAVSRAAVSNAISAEGNQYAPVQLRSASEKLEAAERAMAAKDYELALRLSEQAEVDAKLSAEMARSAKAQKAADAVQDDIRILRQEIERLSK